MNICFCGIDGSGKSYYIRTIYELMKKEDIFVTINDPMKNGLNISELAQKKTRNILLHDNYNSTLISVAYAIDLYNAMNSLDESQLNLIHRGSVSCQVYAKMSGANMEIIHAICKLIPIPDLSVFLKVQPDIAFSRIQKRNKNCLLTWKESYANLCIADEYFQQYYEQQCSSQKCMQILGDDLAFESNVEKIFLQIKKIIDEKIY